MVERLLDWVLRDKRPVYTNLPLCWRVLRKYLEIKGGKECANLINELTEERFNKFIEGFGIRQKMIAEAISAGSSRGKATRDWELLNEGFEEWWIPAGSIIAIDEAHHWYPNPALSNVRKLEPPELMTYLTMHRHGQYLIVIATQAERQLSTTIKSLCSTRYIVKRWDRQPLWEGGFSLEFIGFPILRYEEYQGEEDPEKTKPLKIFTRFPKLPYYQYIFRLYESFTHSGGRREAENAVKKQRLEAGIKDKTVPKTNFTKRTFKFLFKWMFRFFLFGFICFLGYKCGADTAEPLADAESSKTLTVLGISNTTVYLSNKKELKLGSSENGFTLKLLDGKGVAYFEHTNGETYAVKTGIDINSIIME
jgi:hypothetical protein